MPVTSVKQTLFTRSKPTDTLDQIARDGISLGLLQLFADDVVQSSATVKIEGENYVSFGSFSYLGFLFHPALAAGVEAAVKHYGTQFSSSRTYLSLRLYKKLGWFAWWSHQNN
jgi:7-keto-8-aminopelargonate synthetase-like enzyme